MAQNASTDYVGLAITLAPIAINIVQAIFDFKKKHPDVSDDQIQMFVKAITSMDDDSIAKVLKDRAAHPV